MELNCVGPAYEFVGNDLYTVNIGLLGAFKVLQGLLNLLTGAAQPINALGYHSVQNYLYGVSISSVPQTIVRIGAQGTFETAFTLPAAINSQLLIGDVDGAQQYWLGRDGGSNYVQFDLDATSTTYGTVVSSGATVNLTYSVGDWAYVPEYEDRLWSLGQEIVTSVVLGITVTTYNTVLVYFDLATHTWIEVFTFVNAAGGLLGQAQWGAIYSANDGNIYASESNNGMLYQFPLVPNPSSVPTFIALGPVPLGGQAIDGARCPLSNDLSAILTA